MSVRPDNMAGINTIYSIKNGNTINKWKAKNTFVIIDDLFVDIFKHVKDFKIYTLLNITSKTVKKKMDIAINRNDFISQFISQSTDSKYLDMVIKHRNSIYRIDSSNRIFSFSILPNGIKHGNFTIWYLSGKPERIGHYIEGKLNGMVFNYRENGNFSSIETFIMGSRVQVMRYDINGNLRNV